MAERSFADIFIEQLGEAGDKAFELIEGFVKESRAEDLYLDFKEKEDRTKAALSINDERNLNKALSGFANSDGGVIVWGIEARRKGNDSESPDVARARKTIKNLDAFHANLNDKIRLATTPPVPGVINIKIPRKTNSKEGYVVTYVPVGPVPPYRAEKCNNHFYKRSGSNFYHMEPFDIRDIILRDNYPKIKLEFGWVKEKQLCSQERHIYHLLLTVSNAGPTMLETWKMIVEYSNAINADGSPGLPIYAGQRFIDFDGPDGGVWKRLVISSYPGRTPGIGFFPLFPEESISIIGPEASFKVPYMMTREVWRQGGRSFHWRFYGSNTPMQSGIIKVGSGSFCDF